ncbi:hypothetical protein INT45_005277 [Circinella minor]|uniref:Integrase catalytic domain-containing protein n=1 Tax=Circinella minor TaxID=1195481 RepID=A0A8H7VQ77_9FUNG|nr:hypothetical protein INT45_005277 [Circinella minor]
MSEKEEYVIKPGILLGELIPITSDTQGYELSQDDGKRFLNNIPRIQKPLSKSQLDQIEVGDLENNLKQEFLMLIRQYQDIFDWDKQTIGCTNRISHEIITEDIAPIRQRAYRMSPIELEYLKKELDRFCKMETLEYPSGITRQQQRYLDTQSKHYFVYNNRLYRRYKDNNLRLVLNKAESDNAIWTYHFHPMGGKTNSERISTFYTCKTRTMVSNRHGYQTLSTIPVGCPAIVINDNGLPFANKLVEEVCNQFSIERRRGSPYRNQTQGLVERFNRSLGQMLKKRPKHEKDNWCSYLPAALFAYHTIIQETTKQTPFYLLYRREALTPFDRITEKTKEGIINEKWSDDQLVNKIKMQIELLQKPPFHIGDIVQVYNNAIETSWSGKLEETWLGPYIVHKANQRGGYQLKTLKGVMLNGITHGNRMRIYRLPDVQFQPSLSSSKKMPDQLNTLNQDSNLEQLPWDPTIVTSEEIYKLLQDNPFLIRDIDDDFFLSLMEGDTNNHQATNDSLIKRTIGEGDNHPQDLSLSPKTIQLYQEYSRYENYWKNIAQHRARLAEKLVADITNKRNLRNLSL